MEKEEPNEGEILNKNKARETKSICSDGQEKPE